MHAHSVHRAAYWQDHGLEEAVEHELDLDVVRAVRVISPSRQPCALGRRWQEKNS